MDGTADASLVGASLNGQFKIDNLLRHDSHADVYSVKSVSSDTACHEARAYCLEDIPKKLRQYRLRNIKRLSSRIVLETQLHGRVVVVYRIGGTNNRDAKNAIIQQPSALDIKPCRDSKDVKVQQTPHQRETKRLRQLERRKSKRRKEPQSKANENVFSEEEKKPAAFTGLNDERSCRDLSAPKSTDQPLREEIQPGSRYQIALKEIAAKLGLDLEMDDEVEEFIKILHQELMRRPLQRTTKSELVTVVEDPQISIPETPPQILEAASRTIRRPVSALNQDELLAGICGGAAGYVRGFSVHPPTRIPKLSNSLLHLSKLPSRSNVNKLKSGM